MAAQNQPRAGRRIKLRQWIADDIGAFTEMNSDAKVMEFFPQSLTPDQSLALFERLKQGIEQRGWGLWAVEIERELAGFTGLAEANFKAHFTPCVEIGWRFRPKFWGQGYGLEAAQVALRHAFAVLQLPEVVSFTARLNQRSERLMQRLGMTRSPTDDFENPNLPPGHVLRPHILYRVHNRPEVLDALERALAGCNSTQEHVRPLEAPEERHYVKFATMLSCF